MSIREVHTPDVTAMTALTELSPLPELTQLRQLGLAITERGMNADPVELLLLGHTATDLGVSPVLVAVMIDEHEPANARLRAFARVSVAVAASVSAQVAMADVDLVDSDHGELLPAC